MATFGAIGSASPEVFFNPMAADQAVAATQRNRLLMQTAQEDRATARVDRERDEIGRISAALLSLPAEQRPQAYSAAVSDLQRNGLARQAPAEYPGDARVEQLARSALPAAKQFELAEKAKQSEFFERLMSALPGMGGVMGGGAVAGGGMAAGAGSPPPASGGSPAPASPPMTPAQQGEIRERVLSGEISPEEGSRLRSTVPERPGGYRANPGVVGQNAGLPPPTGTINPLVGAALLMGARTNPGALPGMLMAAQGQQAMAAERATDNARADAQFRLSAQQAERQDARTQQQMALQAEAARRAEAAAGRTAETEQERLRIARLAHDPEQIAREAQARASVTQAAPASATEGERKAASYLERMQGAETLLQGMVRGGYNPGNIRDRIAQSTPGVGNFISSREGQQYLNAAEEWARAKLRLESGAVISKEEAQSEARTYFPMPGDSQATIAQKQQLRETATSAVQRQAGRAAGPEPTPRSERPPLSSFQR